MKKTILILAMSLCLFIVTGIAASAGAANSQDAKVALDELIAAYPQLQLYEENSSITRIWGQTFGNGTTPHNAADRFRLEYSPLFGVAPEELHAESFVVQDGNTQQLMYDQETGTYKFTLVYYSQYKDNIPVYRADLRLLARNESGYPLVLAASSLRDLGDFQIDPSKASIDPKAVQSAFATQNPQYIKFGDPRLVVWAGINDMKINPILAVEFVADDGQTPTTNRFRFFIEPSSGEILFQQDLIVDVDVTGQVRGNATENFKSEQCGNEIPTNFPWARVYINSGSPAFADSAGYFTIPNSGSTPVTVTSYIRGRWFQTFNLAGSSSYLTATVTPPGPANFLHNPSNTEYNRAEVNGYVHANVVRDYTLRFNPTYPTIYNQVDFPVNVNSNDYFYCPGNAWYDGTSLTFCRAGSGYPNTAFSTVVHHEYGHHLVEMAGSGQGQYGEGMGDVMGVLITDDPGAAYGFLGPCADPLRNADNTIQYPCSGEIHDCGQLISGCVWSTRNQLILTNPTTYRQILSNLAINAMLLHTGDLITPTITIDYLTLDDDDGNINNGTPHHNEICTGFGDHNMDCPALSLLAFSYPNGKPEFINPAGGTTMRVVVTGIAGTPQPNTGILHYNSGAGWQIIAMTQITPNVYDAVFPAAACRTTVNYYVSAQTTTGYTVNDPANAPSSFFTTLSGTGLVTLYQDDFSLNLGWTGLGGTAEWTIGTCTGGSGNDAYGQPDPSTDHSPSTDNKVLGNDLTSGSGGDYAPNIRLPQYVTSPTINCSGYSGVTLSFWRYLGVERVLYDTASFQVYNGTTWYTLFQNGTTTIDESSWTQFTYDVSAYATNNPNFKMRFSLGGTDAGWQYCGWNIDDIKVTSILCDTIVPGAIAGAVTDAVGNVSGAIVHATGGSNSGWDTTGVDGAYSIPIAPGTYSLALTQIDHRDTTLTGIVVTGGNTTIVNIILQRLPGAIKGTVTSSRGGTLANVRVIALGTGREDTTGSNGVYLITGLTDGTYDVRFTIADYRDTTISGVNVTPGDTTLVNVTMQQLPGWILGTVRDSSGAPIESVYVIINTSTVELASARKMKLPPGMADADNDIPIILATDSVYTDAGGNYSSRALTAATYSAAFSKPLYRDTTISGVIVTPGDTTNVSPTLRRRNRAPVITSPATATATEDILFSYTATASDSDGVIPAISFNGYPPWMSVAGDTIQGTPVEGNPSTAFTVIASDGYLADTQLVVVTVVPVNDPPVLTSPDTATAMENLPFTYTAAAVDPDNVPTFSFLDYPGWLTPSGATISGTPPEAAPSAPFTVIASDGTLADTMTVNITVLHQNDPPLITSPATAEATEDIPFSYVATATDPDGIMPAIAIDNYPAWMAVLGDTISGTPLEGEPSTTFRIIASDSSLADTQVVAVAVTPVNDPPSVTSPDTATAIEHQLFAYTATATDPDGTPVISFAGYAVWLTPVANVLSGTPPEGTVDTTFKVIAFDGVLADTHNVGLTVIPVNDAPIITSPSDVVAIEGQDFTYLGSAIDPEGEPYIINYADYPSWLTAGDASIGGIPPIGAPDTTFKVIADDGFLADTMTVNVTVIAGNQPPVITSPPTASATEHLLFTYTATATDPDGTTPSISIIDYPGWMSVIGPIISGTPGEWAADTTFTIIASDSLLADTLVVSVEVTLINDPPLFTSGNAATALVGFYFEYEATATDPEEAPLTFTFENYPSWLSPMDNLISGTAPSDAEDTSFVVLVSDGEFADTLHVAVTVIGGCAYVPGDISANGVANGLDVVYAVNYFKGGSPPTLSCDCPPYGVLFVSGDVNGSCVFNGIDVIFFVSYLKGQQPALLYCPDCPPGGPVVAGSKDDDKGK